MVVHHQALLQACQQRPPLEAEAADDASVVDVLVHQLPQILGEADAAAAAAEDAVVTLYNFSQFECSCDTGQCLPEFLGFLLS